MAQSLSGALDNYKELIEEFCGSAVAQIHRHETRALPSDIVSYVLPVEPFMEPWTGSIGKNYRSGLGFIVHIPSANLETAQQSVELILHCLGRMWNDPRSLSLSGAVDAMEEPETDVEKDLEEENRESTRITCSVVATIDLGEDDG